MFEKNMFSQVSQFLLKKQIDDKMKMDDAKKFIIFQK